MIREILIAVSIAGHQPGILTQADVASSLSELNAEIAAAGVALRQVGRLAGRPGIQVRLKTGASFTAEGVCDLKSGRAVSSSAAGTGLRKLESQVKLKHVVSHLLGAYNRTESLIELMHPDSYSFAPAARVSLAPESIEQIKGCADFQALGQ